MATRKSVATKDTESTSKAMVNWEDELSKYAQEYGEREPVGGGGRFLSTRGGKFSFQGDVIGESVRVIILDYVFDNAYYEGDFDPDNPQSPTCFALSSKEEDMTPHQESSDAQADTCAECWANKYKSDNRGRGKACKNQRRLAIVAASDEELEKITESVDVGFLRVSPTSLRYFNGFFKKLVKVLGIPPFAVAVDLDIVEEDTAFTVQPNLDSITRVPNNMLGTLVALRDGCQDDLMAPYRDSDIPVEAPAQKQTQRRAAPKKKTTSNKKSAAGSRSAQQQPRRPVRRTKF